MQEPTTQDLARYIYTNGKLIHDRILKIHTACLQNCCQGPGSIGDLSFNQINAIMAVRRRGEVHMTELSALLGVTPASASGMVDRLVEKGILVREHCREDRRRVKVSVSPGAIDQIRQIEEAVLQSFFDLVERLGKQTAQQWCEILGKIKKVLDAEQS
ncbi:MAG: MarR family transcriptional regulator [Desulfosarcinaceae bacterium]|nr:MarR family transcriptional regulator [Desulfosarcinaceae bacterium]